MQVNQCKQICAILAAALLSSIAHATDRDADLIIGLGFNAGKVDEYNSINGFGSAEIAISKDKTWSLLCSGSISSIDTPNDQTGQIGLIGINHYFTDKTSLALFAGLGHNRFKVDETITADTRYTREALAFDYKVDVLAPVCGITLKQRLLPATAIFSPYVSAGAMVSKSSANVDGTVKYRYEDYYGWAYTEVKAKDVIKYEYDTNFDLAAGAGVDIYLSKNVGLVIGGEFGRTFGGGHVEIGDTKVDFEKDAYNWWQIGGGLKIFI